MDVKCFLQSPSQALLDLRLSAGEVKATQLIALADKLGEIRGQLKDVKKDKAEVARQFKLVVVETEEHSRLIKAMKTVSDKAKALEQDCKAAEKNLQILLDNQAIPTDELPPPFVYIQPDNNYAGSYQVRELLATEKEAWHQFLSTQQTTAYHQSAWANIIKASFGHSTRIWVAVSAEDEILGGIPLTFFNSKLFGKFAVSLPYFNYGGVITPWFNLARKLLEYLQSVCIAEGLSHIEVRTMQADLGGNLSNKKASMLLALPSTEATLEEQLGAKVRAQYKKAEIYEPRVSFGKLELLDDFYRVFARNMRDLGTPVYAKQWFANILAHPDINSQLVVVYVNGQAVSSGFLIGYQNMLEIPWASTVKEANAMNTNMWMYRQILGYGIRQGYEYFDFGRSTQDAGTFKFKKQWGAQPHTHYWYYLFPEGGGVPELNPDNPKYKLMIAVWKRLPIWLTQLIGPPIVGSLP